MKRGEMLGKERMTGCDDASEERIEDKEDEGCQVTSFLPMLLRTRAPIPSDCSTLRTHFSTLLTLMAY